MPTSGWNPDTTIPNAATRTYTYYVGDAKMAGGSITDMTGGFDKRGLYGAYTVSPEGATIRNPVTGDVTDVGASVDVEPQFSPSYRDFTLVLSEDETQIGASFMPYPVNVDKAGSVRTNYQQAPRDDTRPDAFSSAAFGDPTTPLLSAYAGDREVMHVLVAPGSEQMHSMNFGGLSFSLDPNIPNADSSETRAVGPWEMLTATISGGAGGATQQPGDYFYGDMRRVFTKAGMWGLQRVLPGARVVPGAGERTRVPAAMTRSRAVGGRQPPTARRGALWLVLPMVGLALVAVLGVVIWVSPHRAPTPESSGSAALGGAPGGSGGSVRTSSAKGSHAGYDATVESTRTEIGSATLTTLDVFLSTEGEPASAPTA